MPAAGRTTASGCERGTPRSSPGANDVRPSAAPWSARDSAHTAPSASSPPTSALAASTCAATAAAPPSKSTATRPGRRMSTALGTSCEREQRRARPRRVVGLDDHASRPPPGAGAGAGDPRDEREPAARAAEELAEVVAGDVLHDLAAGARDRAVGEHDA